MRNSFVVQEQPVKIGDLSISIDHKHFHILCKSTKLFENVYFYYLLFSNEQIYDNEMPEWFSKRKIYYRKKK